MTAVIARQEQHVIASVGLPRPGVSARRTGRARPAHKRQHCGHAQACAAARRPAVSFWTELHANAGPSARRPTERFEAGKRIDSW